MSATNFLRNGAEVLAFNNPLEDTAFRNVFPMQFELQKVLVFVADSFC